MLEEMVVRALHQTFLELAQLMQAVVAVEQTQPQVRVAQVAVGTVAQQVLAQQQGRQTQGVEAAV
jgi:uncharacterized protein YjaG (DUF416 family)